MEIFTDYAGNKIGLTFNSEEFRTPKHVLILPFYNGKLVFTKHKERGIELPGGKIETGESSLAAAVREVYEEIGATLSSIKLIGQYTLTYPDHQIIKSIYQAEVEVLDDIAFTSDTEGPILFEQLPVHIKDDPQFSMYMKDEVYPRTLQFLGLIDD